jgi:hypothetical protein
MRGSPFKTEARPADAPLPRDAPACSDRDERAPPHSIVDSAPVRKAMLFRVSVSCWFPNDMLSQSDLEPIREHILCFPAGRYPLRALVMLMWPAAGEEASMG